MTELMYGAVGRPERKYFAESSDAQALLVRKAPPHLEPFLPMAGMIGTKAI